MDYESRENRGSENKLRYSIWQKKKKNLKKIARLENFI